MSTAVACDVSCLAAHFRGGICSDAIAAANHTHWAQSQVPPNILQLQQRTYDVTTHKGINMTYVRNQKAASDYLISALAAVFRSKLKVKHAVLPTVPSSVVPARAPTSWLWTVVREPIQTAVSGYLQLSSWPAAHDQLKPQAAWRAMPCSRPNSTAAASTRRFDAFLEDLVHARPLGYSVHHVYPQALKINVHGAVEGSGTNRPLAFSAIGRVESLASDVLDIARQYGAVDSPALPVAVAAHVHSHSADPCRNIEMTRSIMHKLCFLYAVDYACFPVYRHPVGCQVPLNAQAA